MTDLNKLNEQKEVITIKSDFAGMESKEELKSDENVEATRSIAIQKINKRLQNLGNEIKLYMLQANGIKIPYDDIELVNGLNLSFDEIEYFCKHPKFCQVADDKNFMSNKHYTRMKPAKTTRRSNYVLCDKSLKKVKIDKDTTRVMPIYTTRTQFFKHEEGFVNDDQKYVILDIVYRKMYTNLCENRYIDVIENTDQHAAAQIAHRFSGDSLAEFMINFSEKNQLYMGTQGKNPWEKNSLENCVRMIHNITYPEDNDPFRGSYVGQLSYMMKIPNQQDNKYYQLVIGKEGKEESLSKQGQVNNMTIITFTERNWSDGFKDPVEALMLDKTYEERTSYLRDYDEFKQEMSYRWDHSYNSEFKGEYKNKGDFYKQSIL